MLRCIVVGGFLCACSFDPSGFASSGDGDADPNAPDSDPSAPDAEPLAIDAEPPAIDAEPVPPDAMSPPPDAAPVLRTIVFRDGLGGYTGTRDTSLRESEAFELHGSDGTIRWDMVSGASPEGQDYGLLRFENITGIGSDAIPTGATIVSATLSIIGSLKYFDLVYMMARGAPEGYRELMATYIYRLGFEDNLQLYGRGSAVAVVLFVLAMVVAAIVTRAGRKEAA